MFNQIQYLQYKKRYLILKNQILNGGGGNDILHSDILNVVSSYSNNRNINKLVSSSKDKINKVDWTKKIESINTNLDLSKNKNKTCEFTSDIVQKDACNLYINRRRLKSLFKYYVGSNEPKNYDIDTINDILVKSIIKDNGNRESDIKFLQSLGGNVNKIYFLSFHGIKINGQVNIPNFITTIGYNTFKEKGVTSVTIPNSVTNIIADAFYENEIEELHIPDSVIEIGKNAFFKNKLNTLTLSESITRIEEGAFSNNLLTSVVIPRSIKLISNNLFYQNKLKEIIIPDSIRYIGDFAFAYNCLTHISIPNTIARIGEKAFKGNKLKCITIPSSITHIDDYAFADNDLTNIIIPPNVLILGYGCFDNNPIKDVTLPKRFEGYHSMSAFSTYGKTIKFTYY
jgi:hypothetical protein